MTRLVLLLVFSLSFVSCGKNANVWPVAEVKAQSVGPATSEDFTYQFSGSRCTTGAQASATFEGICTILKDDEINQGCAQSKREELFISAQCPGSFN
jgi:hypothetical protein